MGGNIAEQKVSRYAGWNWTCLWLQQKAFQQTVAPPVGISIIKISKQRNRILIIVMINYLKRKILYYESQM